jgi:hypothetical protein
MAVGSGQQTAGRKKTGGIEIPNYKSQISNKSQ